MSPPEQQPRKPPAGLEGIVRSTSEMESIRRSIGLQRTVIDKAQIASIQKLIGLGGITGSVSQMAAFRKAVGVDFGKPPAFASALYGEQFAEMTRRLTEWRTPFESFVLSPLPLPRFELPQELLRLTEGLDRWAERLRQPLTPDERRLVEFRMARGWYMSPEEPIGQRELMEMLARDDRDGVEAAIAEVARSRVEGLAARVGAWSPARQPLVEIAVEAHARGDYALSVPVLLAQADGFGKDILGVSVYGWQDNRDPAAGPKTRRRVVESQDRDERGWQPTLRDAYLVYLHDGSSLLAATWVRDERRKRDPSYGPLNRHGVLHGSDTDYGTETNGLRAVMFLDYLAWIADDFVAPLVAEVSEDESSPSSEAEGSVESEAGAG